MNGVLTMLAWLPLGVLYSLSTLIIYPLLLVGGYRREVIRRNIRVSFPDKTRKERRRIERKFYLNFADSIVETVKLLHISDREIVRRVKWDNLDVLKKQIETGRSVVIYFSHCFNWEWAPSVTLHLDCPGVVFGQIYRPLRSKKFDELMLRVRSRFGSRSLPKATALRSLVKDRQEGLVSVTGFMSDQRSSHGDPGYQTSFLGHTSLMISGTETLARKLGTAVVYWDMERNGRGRYTINTRLISEDASKEPEGKITGEYTRMLEKTIRRDPSNWLWSHNRWKKVAR